jgi:hypothetical protein
MSNETNSTPQVSASFDRRGLFRIGGITIATAAVIAACGDPAGSAGELGRVGNGEPTPTLPEGDVNDGVLLRTSASFETSIADAYQRMIDEGMLAVPSATFPELGDQTALVTGFLDQHRKAAETYNQLALEAGAAEPFTCGNPRLDSAFIDPIFERVQNGAPASDTAKEIPPSDDPTRDMVNLVVTLELLSAATAQGLVPQVSQASYRAEAMRLAARSARQGALMSLKINPGAYVSQADLLNANPAAPTTVASTTTVQDIAAPETGDTTAPSAPPPTVIPLPVALPSQYGSLAAITYIGGAGDENGVRLKLNFETPSLNSLTYDFTTCE